jgi:hypothetical protein
LRIVSFNGTIVKRSARERLSPRLDENSKPVDWPAHRRAAIALGPAQSASDLIFSKREVGEICIDEKQRRTDLKWIVQVDNPRWMRPLSDWPVPSNNISRLLGRNYYFRATSWDGFANWRILLPQAEVQLNGVKDVMIVSAFDLNFLLRSPLQEFFTKEPRSLSTNANDLRWALLWIASDNVNWISGPATADRFLEQLGKEEGIWDNLLNYCGEVAAPEIAAFRVAARESSWKRFGAALWIRDNNE